MMFAMRCIKTSLLLPTNYILFLSTKALYFDSKIYSMGIEENLETFHNNLILKSKPLVSFFPYVIVFFIIISIFTIFAFIFFIKKFHQENQQLSKLKKQLEYIAYYNTLTNLPNRNAYKLAISSFVSPVAFLVNIDHFKHINDFYGFGVGDSILSEYADFLKRKLDDLCPKANLYYLGADEFIAVLELGQTNDKELLHKQIAENIIIATKNNKFYYREIEISIRVSIGISRGDRLLEKADMVLKYIKREARLSYLEFHENLNLRLLMESNFKILQFLKAAVDQDLVEPFFQPIFNNSNNKVYKYECLARVKNEKGQYVLPADFFKVAKETIYYREITRKILQKSFQKFSENQFSFAINISIEDILDYTINDNIEELFLKYPNIAHRLTFEILESEEIRNYQQVVHFISRMKKFGCKFAVDDFGSGYSNFAHLLGLQVDYLKIDGSLIHDIDKNKNSRLVVETIVNFSNITGIQTVAEFVHSKEIYYTIKEIGIDYSQGFYLGKPEKVLISDYPHL